MKNRGYEYSVNPLSLKENAALNVNQTLDVIHGRRELLKRTALKNIPKDELSLWVLVDQLGFHNNALYDVYIAVRQVNLFTPKGRCRRVTEALKILGVPFVNVDRTTQGYEKADGGAPVVLIRELKHSLKNG